MVIEILCGFILIMLLIGCEDDYASKRVRISEDTGEIEGETDEEGVEGYI